MNEDFPKYDLFPNAPGLSEKLGLCKATTLPRKVKGWGPWKRRWLSICSKHREPVEECRLCMVGNYRVAWRSWVSHVVYRLCPRLWRWWVNR